MPESAPSAPIHLIQALSGEEWPLQHMAIIGGFGDRVTAPRWAIFPEIRGLSGAGVGTHDPSEVQKRRFPDMSVVY